MRNRPSIAILVAALGLVPACTGDGDTDTDTDTTPPRPEHLWGVDANYVIVFEELGGTWRVDGVEVDPIEAFATHGAEVFRLRIWVDNHPGNQEPGTLEDDALALAVRAQEAGLYVIPTLFMSRGWGADIAQDAPLDWADLSIADRAAAAKAWAKDAVTRLMGEGIVTNTFGVGNETDYGFCGVFQMTDDLDVLRTAVWPDAAVLMRATIEGIEEATGNPDPEILLHVSRGQDPDLAVAFFQTMQQQGVDFSLAGLSYYPSSWGQAGYEQFEVTVDRLDEELGLPVVIPEYAYPADDRWVGWNDQVDDYALSEEGQAAFVRDLKARVQTDPRIEGAVYWSPEEALESADWSVMSLFQSHPLRQSPGARLALDEL